MKWLFAVVVLLLSACGNNAAAICRAGNVVLIKDAAAWQQYVSAARMADLGYQRDNPTDRDNFVSPLIIVPGFDLDAPHIHWFADSGVQITTEPRESDVTILREGKPIAVFQNYIWSDWLGNSRYQCVTEYRELYGIDRQSER